MKGNKILMELQLITGKVSSDPTVLLYELLKDSHVNLKATASLSESIDPIYESPQTIKPVPTFKEWLAFIERGKV